LRLQTYKYTVHILKLFCTMMSHTYDVVLIYRNEQFMCM